MDSLSALLLSLEEQLLDINVRTDADALTPLLADSFMEFSSSGRIYTKQEIVDELVAEAPQRLSLYNFVCQALSPDAALLTYRSRSEAGEALRSSIWIYRSDRWQMLFHQSTKLLRCPG